MKARARIGKELATLRPPLQWFWAVELTDPSQGGHLYATSKKRYLTRIGCWLGFIRHGLKWLIRAWLFDPLA